jgi:hypothetical protein
VDTVPPERNDGEAELAFVWTPLDEDHERESYEYWSRVPAEDPEARREASERRSPVIRERIEWLNRIGRRDAARALLAAEIEGLHRADFYQELADLKAGQLRGADPKEGQSDTRGADALSSLTARQSEIARLWLEGKNQRQIADILGLAPVSVGKRVCELRKDLGQDIIPLRR